MGYNSIIAKCIANIPEPDLPAFDSFLFTGTGKCANIAQLVANTMSSLGRPSFGISATELLHGSLGCVQAVQCIIAFSSSGKTEETQRALEEIRVLWPDKPVYCITCSKGYSGAGTGLFIGEAEELNYFGSPTTSSAMFVAWAMSYCESIRAFNRKEFILCHPGGALGAQNA